MRRKSFVLVIMLVLMAVIVGCGGTDQEVVDTDTKPETPPEVQAPEAPPAVQANPLEKYELFFSEQPPGPEGVILSFSAYKAPTGAKAATVLGDFGQWAEEEGWSVLIPADAEGSMEVFRMLMGDPYDQDYYKKGNEVMIIGVAEAEAEDKLVIAVIAGLPLSDFE